MLSARVGVDGAAELGVLGVGGWTVRFGDQEHQVDLGLTGADPGEALLRPPAWTTTLRPRRREIDLEAESSRPGNRFREVRARRPAGAATVADVLAEAVRGGRGCDVAVVVVGLTEEQETEAATRRRSPCPASRTRW